jgi:hypothetical protein
MIVQGWSVGNGKVTACYSILSRLPRTPDPNLK